MASYGTMGEEWYAAEVPHISHAPNGPHLVTEGDQWVLLVARGPADNR